MIYTELTKENTIRYEGYNFALVWQRLFPIFVYSISEGYFILISNFSSNTTYIWEHSHHNIHATRHTGDSSSVAEEGIRKSLFLKMKAIRSFETSATVFQATRYRFKNHSTVLILSISHPTHLLC
jgi:hypothetical protein